MKTAFKRCLGNEHRAGREDSETKELSAAVKRRSQTRLPPANPAVTQGTLFHLPSTWNRSVTPRHILHLRLSLAGTSRHRVRHFLKSLSGEGQDDFCAVLLEYCIGQSARSELSWFCQSSGLSALPSKQPTVPKHSCCLPKNSGPQNRRTSLLLCRPKIPVSASSSQEPERNQRQDFRLKNKN